MMDPLRQEPAKPEKPGDSPESPESSGRLYRIGEVARALRLEASALRFWETEFAHLRPIRTPKGQRLYREADMLLLRRIRSLLHEQGMTIEGARRVLDRAPENQPPSAASALLRDTARELQALIRLLQTPFTDQGGAAP